MWCNFVVARAFLRVCSWFVVHVCLVVCFVRGCEKFVGLWSLLNYIIGGTQRWYLGGYLRVEVTGGIYGKFWVEVTGGL